MRLKFSIMKSFFNWNLTVLISDERWYPRSILVVGQQLPQLLTLLGKCDTDSHTSERFKGDKSKEQLHQIIASAILLAFSWEKIRPRRRFRSSKTRTSKRENVEDGSVVIRNKKVEAEEDAKTVSIPTTKRTSRASLRNASKKNEKKSEYRSESEKKKQTRSEEAPIPKIRTRSSARVASSAENSPKSVKNTKFQKSPKISKSPQIRKSQKILVNFQKEDKNSQSPKAKKNAPESKSVTFAHQNSPVPVRKLK